MTQYYLSRYVEIFQNGRLVHTPLGSDQEGWFAIDLRPHSGKLDGRCFLAVPIRDDQPQMDFLGDNLDEITPGLRGFLNSNLDVMLPGPIDNLRDAIIELLLNHGDDRADRNAATHWRSLKRGTRSREIWLGELIFQELLPPLFASKQITESFNTGDSDTLGPDLSWSELTGDLDIQSLAFGAGGIASRNHARAETDLDTSNNEAFVDVATIVNGNKSTRQVGPVCRMNASDASGFLSQFEDANDVYTVRLVKNVGGTWSNVTATIGISLAVDDELQVQADGSTIKAFQNGTERRSATDTDNPTGVRCGIYNSRTDASDHMRGYVFVGQDIGFTGEVVNSIAIHEVEFSGVN